MRWAAVALVGLVCACAAATPHAGVPSTSPIAAVTPSPGASAVSTVIPFSSPGFKCRLPITLFSGAARSGAFIDFPSGSVTPDPASAEVNAIPQPGRELIDKTHHGLYYDKAYARWLPVYRNAVAPDGAHYAYTDRDISPGANAAASIALHVVDVKTGIGRTGYVGPWDLRFVVVDYASEGIYLRDSGSVGVDFVDPVKDEMQHAVDLGDYEGSAGNGYFWQGVTNPDDPNAISSNELDKVNRVDSSRVVWFYRPRSNVRFLAQDPQGHPIVVISPDFQPSEFLYLHSPGVSREILRPGNGGPAISDPIADSHGVWFGAQDGIYLYTELGGLRQVSRQAGPPANGCL